MSEASLYDWIDEKPCWTEDGLLIKGDYVPLHVHHQEVAVTPYFFQVETEESLMVVYYYIPILFHCKSDLNSVAKLRKKTVVTKLFVKKITCHIHNNTSMCQSIARKVPDDVLRTRKWSLLISGNRQNRCP